MSGYKSIGNLDNENRPNITTARKQRKAGVAAEVIGVPSGSIGEKLYNAKIYLNTPDLFAWTIVIIVISFVFEKCFLGIVSRVVYMIEHR